MTKSICLRTTFAAALLFALSPSGCAGDPAQSGPTFGGAQVRMYSQLPPSNISSVTVTITADDIETPIVVPLTWVDGQWTANISEIPVGTNRTFTLEARDDSGTILYSGVATGVTISAGQSASVSISGQEANPPAGSDNASPVIDALVASSMAVVPGATVTLSVSAHDPNAGDTLTYLWTSANGSFDSADTSSTNWTAPETEGTYQISIQVQDDHQARTTMPVTITVRSESDAGTTATISVTLNNWPVVTGVTSTQGRIDVNESTKLDLVASDADGDNLTYAWTADSGCAGTFDAADAKSPTFTLGSTLPSSGTCTFTVAVDDGHGGTNTGALTIAAAPAPVPTVDTVAPTLTALSFSPSSVDVTEGDASVTVAATIVDDLSGFSAARFMFGDPADAHWQTCWMYKSEGSSAPQTFSGTCTVTIPQHSQAGAWKIVQIYLSDDASNGITLTSEEVAAQFPLSNALTVTSSAAVDTTAPTLTALSISPASIDTDSGSVTVTVSFTATDDLSGVTEVGVGLSSPSGSQRLDCYFHGSAVPAPLTLSTSCSIVIPQNSEAGEWFVEWLYVIDGVSNPTFLGPNAQHEVGGFPATLSVTSGT